MIDKTAPPSINHFCFVVTSCIYNKSFFEVVNDEEGVAEFTVVGPLGRFPTVVKR